MDIKELDKKQLILLTLLITFVVSIATGIITVSLMNQMPKSVPQTINNVIQRTIEKVTTVEVPSNDSNKVDESKDSDFSILGDGDVLVSLYYKYAEIIDGELSGDVVLSDESSESKDENKPKKPLDRLGQGVIISETGLILVETNILKEGENKYKVVLDKTEFYASVLKKYSNGFSILKISKIEDSDTDSEVDEDSVQ